VERLTHGGVTHLWSGPAPLALGEGAEDVPTLTAFVAERPNGASVVVCPGGGYGMLADHEGTDYARFLNQLGISAFVLKYRLGSNGYRHPAMLWDAARAVRLVRSCAVAQGLDPARVGIMGSSAGGHLASTLLVQHDGGDPSATDPVDRYSSRPDLGILCYPVITLMEFGHRGSQDALLGEGASEAQRIALSNDRHVTPATPPTFLWHTGEDDCVPVENSLAFALALRRNGVPFDLHVYERGNHGLGLADAPPFPNAHPWAADLTFWLKSHGWTHFTSP